MDIEWIKDYMGLVWNQLTSRKKRSWLTLLGIVIGVTAIVSLFLVGSGLENALSAQLDTLGSDTLFISPKGSALSAGLATSTSSLTIDDQDDVDDVIGISMTAGFIYTTGSIEFNDVTRYFLVYGNEEDPEARRLLGESQNYKIDFGRVLEKGHKYKAVLGTDYLDSELFGRALDVGDSFLVNGYEFDVIGFWQPIGSSTDDRTVSIPLETYWEVYGGKDELGLIMAEVSTGQDLEVVSERVSKALRKSRGLEEGKEDFQIQTPQQLAASFSAILSVVSAVLVGIAGISLFVGGVGIMNTMFTAVLQRTREIGVLKAIGAKRAQILWLFLFESALFGLIGGLIGVLIGVSFAKGIEFAFLYGVAPNLFIVDVSYVMLIVIVLGSGLFGGLCGYLPARKAAKANAVESLRYE